MDRDWRPLKVSYEYPLPSILPEKPVNLTGLLEAAEKIAKTLIFCRVDFYILGGELYFGEVAFYPEGGYGIFEPRKFNERLLKGLQNEGCFDEIYYM